jgi:predicted dehydrogenase
MRTAVVGVGYLGRFHAQKYAVLPNSELVGIADPSHAVREAVGAELGVPAYADHRELLGRVDAVSIVTPTPYHFTAAKEFLEAGVHVLVEKPMTSTVEEGEGLIEAARRAKRILQVGHLERFNAAVRAVQPILTIPRFIESARLAPFKLQSRLMRSAAACFPRRLTLRMPACASRTAASPMPRPAASA